MKFTICAVLLVTLLQSLESNAQTACNSDPCMNESVCFNSVSGDTFFCLCVVGYTGVQCEISLPGTCPPNYPCVHGFCRADGMGTPHCTCFFEYEGSDCNQEGSKAYCVTHSPCLNNSTCFTSSVDSSAYFCDCTSISGYTGRHCEIKGTSLEDPCLPNPCQNGGNCNTDALNPSGYHCACPVHFSGQHCSTDDRLTCSFDGNTYNNREVRDSGCNLCTCYDGGWSCTDSTCGGTCQYEDMIFLENDSRQDDCNTCYCLHGEWMCTTQQCSGSNVCEFAESDYIELYNENEYRWEQCNVCYCLSGLWACTTRSCSNRTVIKVSFGFDGEFADILNIIEPFKIVLHDDISTAYDIPKNVIEQIEVSGNYRGIDVSFSLVGSQDGVVDANKMLSIMQTPINSGDYIFLFNGVRYQSRPNSFYSTQIWPENPSVTSSGVDSMVVLIILCGVSGVGFLVIILGVYLYIKTANTKRGDTKYGNAKLPNRRTGLDNSDQTRLTRGRSTMLPTSLHI